MLCENCNTAEATVHITEIVAGAPNEMKKRDFCDACFSQSDLAKKLSGKIPDSASNHPGYTATILPDDEPGN
jgi:protein-arginine kinase activator protein McsA